MDVELPCDTVSTCLSSCVLDMCALTTELTLSPDTLGSTVTLSKVKSFLMINDTLNVPKDIVYHQASLVNRSNIACGFVCGYLSQSQFAIHNLLQDVVLADSLHPENHEHVRSAGPEER